MGADIEIETEDGKVHYFRDSYNETNLAWVARLSYWSTERKNAKKLLKKMSEISDTQIDCYIHSKTDNLQRIMELKSFLTEKRNNLRKWTSGKFKIEMWSV